MKTYTISIAIQSDSQCIFYVEVDAESGIDALIVASRAFTDDHSGHVRASVKRTVFNTPGGPLAVDGPAR